MFESLHLRISSFCNFIKYNFFVRLFNYVNKRNIRYIDIKYILFKISNNLLINILLWNSFAHYNFIVIPVFSVVYLGHK